MNFEQILPFVKSGSLAQRAGWNGKGMYIFQINDWDCKEPPAFDKIFAREPELSVLPFLPFLAMRTADGCFVPWLASQTDMLATDWEILA